MVRAERVDHHEDDVWPTHQPRGYLVRGQLDHLVAPRSRRWRRDDRRRGLRRPGQQRVEGGGGLQVEVPPVAVLVSPITRDLCGARVHGRVVVVTVAGDAQVRRHPVAIGVEHHPSPAEQPARAGALVAHALHPLGPGLAQPGPGQQRDGRRAAHGGQPRPGEPRPPAPARQRHRRIHAGVGQQQRRDPPVDRVPLDEHQLRPQARDRGHQQERRHEHDRHDAASASACPADDGPQRRQPRGGHADQRVAGGDAQDTGEQHRGDGAVTRQRPRADPADGPPRVQRADDQPRRQAGALVPPGPPPDVARLGQRRSRGARRGADPSPVIAGAAPPGKLSARARSPQTPALARHARPP